MAWRPAFGFGWNQASHLQRASQPFFPARQDDERGRSMYTTRLVRHVLSLDFRFSFRFFTYFGALITVLGLATASLSCPQKDASPLAQEIREGKRLHG